MFVARVEDMVVLVSGLTVIIIGQEVTTTTSDPSFNTVHVGRNRLAERDATRASHELTVDDGAGVFDDLAVRRSMANVRAQGAEIV